MSTNYMYLELWLGFGLVLVIYNYAWFTVFIQVNVVACNLIILK